MLERSIKDSVRWEIAIRIQRIFDLRDGGKSVSQPLYQEASDRIYSQFTHKTTQARMQATCSENTSGSGV